MDSIFLQPDGARATFLQQLVHAFGCSYICLWFFSSPSSNCLIFTDGFYNELESVNQPSSSTGSLARRLFEEYRKLIFVVDNDRVPGLAFKNRLPFMELKELELQGLASAEAQLQFYQRAIFMGCNAGEIELGMSIDTQDKFIFRRFSQANLEMEMKNWFPDDFSGKKPIREFPILADQNRPSSSSSSLRSLSMESQEFSPFLLNIPSSSLVAEPPKEAPLEQALRPVSSSASISPLHQAMQAFSQIRNAPFPTPETEDAAMTKAILAVLSSPSSSSSSWQQQNLNPPTQKSSAFKRYRSGLVPIAARIQRQNMLKRAITFLRTLNLTRRQERVQGSRPTSTQLHHTISERKRREKLNESFQALRSLLPPGTKKDKASVLASTTQYLTSLKAQVADLSRRNRVLEAQILPRREASGEASRLPTTERLDVRVTGVAESTSEARIVDLQVIVRGDCNMLDLVIRMLEFFKQIRNVSLMSTEADTQVEESSSINRVVFRLNIEGGDWDESAFQEAVRRVVADMAQ
ncbi:putative transcription factor bHLH041 isoform X2 [Diospyros lotus]|uniref:putative transcription factor bHLH041 isoform X2 n=1 Tax=Diospyros lotus TaxID=55363 RepID=UPI0022518EB6|nr:putative transcription factor bHLH041 isoform X2 [Diospyros lotus]